MAFHFHAFLGGIYDRLYQAEIAIAIDWYLPRRGFRATSKQMTKQSFTLDQQAESERIAKRIARAGICSRREAEARILDGRVTVNGNTIGERGKLELINLTLGTNPIFAAPAG